MYKIQKRLHIAGTHAGARASLKRGLFFALSRRTRRMPSPKSNTILKDSIVIDTLGGAVVHPTPYVPAGQTYEENMVGWGWNVLHA